MFLEKCCSIKIFLIRSFEILLHASIGVPLSPEPESESF